DRGMQSIPIMAAQQVIQRTIPTLERRVDEVVVSKPEAIDFVMSSVQIVDSAGLNWLLAVQSRLETLGIHMRLVDLSPIMSDVLRATRLESRFTVGQSGAANGNGNGAGGAHAG